MHKLKIPTNKNIIMYNVPTSCRKLSYFIDLYKKCIMFVRSSFYENIF